MADDTTFQEAVDALRRGDKARAKELLTELLKTDQNNPTYWIWLSAAVGTSKERIYCLQTALRFDPENTTAKRGLILLGALSPDENIQPFPLNRPRAWEDKLLLEHEKPKPGGLQGLASNPVTRLAGILVLGIVVCALAITGMTLPRRVFQRPGPSRTPGPSPTFTSTPTLIGGKPGAPTPTFIGPTPLAALLGISYTPTPLYVNTPRSPLSGDTYRVAKAALSQGDLDGYIRSMKEIARAEPDAADVPFYIGEAYRLSGNCRDALEAYNNSLKIDNKFGPAYLGLARARLCQDRGADVTQLFDLAIQADPNFGETYLERANFFLERDDPASALLDLQSALQRMPDSALVQLGFARAYLLRDERAGALEAAKKANQTDLTLLASYYYLGQAYIVNQQYKEAIKPLETYLIYAKKDGGAYALLGEAYARTGVYQPAVDALTQALLLDPTQRRSFIYRGLANLELGNLDEAEYDYRKALDYYPESFDANLGLTRTYYSKEEFGSAYLQAEAAYPLAADNREKALALYWRALCQEKRGNFKDAIKDWRALLALPESAMTPQMRNDAQVHLTAIVTPTNTPKGGVKTPTPSRTPTKTP
jgi:tetratricopeptide (TPR) repeat protein